jgi:hypothetical protein
MGNSAYHFENTALWQNALGQTENDPEHVPKERLRTVYRSFWSNAVQLAVQIQKDVPGLTLHDETHFEALWARANQIAGPGFNLTPLEAFVFGGAILVHDAANTVAAFSGGVSELKQTDAWKDAEADLLDVNHPDDASAPLTEDENKIVLFDTLRNVHAQRAESLCSLSVSHNSKTFHLLPDDSLRTHLGYIIGLIGASHHWDISKLTVRLQSIVGAPSGFPETWSIRPVLLACLLRCADAAQLEQARTPDFLYGLLKLQGISELHWRAQNRIAAPVVDQNDAKALVYSSTMPFTAQDADAWWIAFDALQIANRELQTTDALLRDLRLPAFAINRIAHAEAPDRLATHLVVNGWQPVSAEVRITKVSKVVDMFGGEQLYGKDLHVPLRELIQNAADAIRQRKALEPKNSSFVGNIVVRCELGSCDSINGHWLHVEDDGLGMSEAVLTGPLIDFGSSYMSSSIVKSERPGLISKRQRRLGQFGIGFFSVFMLADNVDVVSKPFDRAVSDARSLRFRRGVGTRPLLLDTTPSDFGASLSTRVSLFITEEKWKGFLKVKPQSFSENAKFITLAELVGQICPMLDVDVFVDFNQQRDKVHSSKWYSEDKASWLSTLLLPEVSSSSYVPEAINLLHPIMTFLNPACPDQGLAAISFFGGCGVRTVGTLASRGAFNNHSDDFIGAIDYEPDGPRRGSGRALATEYLEAWATDQASKLSTIELTPQQKYRASCSIARFGGDASALILMSVRREPKKLDELYQLLLSGEELFATLKYLGSWDDKRVGLGFVREKESGLIDHYRTNELEFLLNALEPIEDNSNDQIVEIPTEGHLAPVGFFTMLKNYAAARGYKLESQMIDDLEFARYIGKSSERDGLHAGKIIKRTGLKLFIQTLTNPV